MVCSATEPTALPSSINIPSITSGSVSVSWTEIECIERNGPITNYTVEFQEVRGALIPGVVVNRTFTASGLTPYTDYNFGPFSNVTSILTGEESNQNYSYAAVTLILASCHNFLMCSSWSCV